MSADLLSILIVGDSHIGGFQPQTYQLSVDDSGRQFSAMTLPVNIGTAYVAFDSVVTFPDGRLGLNPAFDVAMSRWPGLDVKGRPIAPTQRAIKHLVLSLGTGLNACDPASTFDDLIEERLLFRNDVDFVLPARRDLPVDQTCTVLPVALFRDMFRAILEPLRKALSFLSQSHPHRLWLMEAPPPSENNLVKQRTISSRAEKMGKPPITVASPTVSLKAWLLMSECAREICREVGAGFIDCAPFACNERGYLRPEFQHDGFHGNALFRDIMGQRIVATIASTEAKSLS